MRNLVRVAAGIAALAALVPVALSAQTPGPTLGPGSPAPALDVKTWFKGTPVKEFEAGKVYVVEFWATWCGPCRVTIPHLTKLAKANPDVTFLGISIWEDHTDQNIEKFIAGMGDQMDYVVGYSGNQEGMAQTWMRAAGQNGIPAAFIVKDKQIQWIGHPMEMDEPLAQVKAGTFDLAKFKASFEAEQKSAQEMQAAMAKLRGIQKKFSDGQRAEAKKELDELVAATPRIATQAETVRFEWLLKEDEKAWEAEATKRLKGNLDQRMSVVMLGMSGLNRGGNREQGKKILELALKVTEEKDLLPLYYSAVFFSEIGEAKRALALVDKAIAALPTSEFKDNAQLREALTKMRAEFAAKAGG